jgi:hypothetical protein
VVDNLLCLWLTYAMSNNTIANGTRVIVRHETGITEFGVVRSRTNPAMPDDAMYGKYTIEFDNGSWFAAPVRTVSVA